MMLIIHLVNLNLGIKAGKSQYVVLCNNDLTFEKNWASIIINAMQLDKDLLSASPFCPQVLNPIAIQADYEHRLQ